MKSEVFKQLKKQTLTSEKKAGKIFNPFFETIIDVAFFRMIDEEDITDVLEDELSSVLDRHILMELLFKVSKRVLIGDMNMRREMGDLIGETEEAQYEDYVYRYLMQPAYLQQLFQEYPAWEEALLRATEYFIRNVKEIIQHLRKDRKSLNAEFFSRDRFDKIRRITGSGSDTHCENRIVYCVELDNGRRIYHKSRVNTGVRFFNALYASVCEEIGLSFHINPSLTGDGYVWENEAVYAECANAQEVQNYFVRLGIILSICHLCHGGDMHYENMIASGEFPMIIDFETLVQMVPEPMPENGPTASQIIGDSVLPIGILPFYGSRSQNFNADFSGLCGGGKQVMDIRVPIIENPGKSTMCIAYKYGETGEKMNRVRLNGEYVQPQDHMDALERGYTAGYRYILEHPNKLLELTSLMEGAMYRQLFRNTQEYHMILDLSYHPEFMRELGKRREFLENALTTPLFEERLRILKQEIEDMLKGDVPYFQFEMSTGDLYNSKGEKLEHFFETSGMEFLKSRIMNRCEEDLKLQKQFMEIALRYSQVEELTKLYETVDGTGNIGRDALALCCRIADEICEHHLDVSDRILWMNTRIMMTGVDKRHTYFMELSDRYLYEGTMGMAVFMAAFLKICPEHKIRYIYQRIVEDLFEYTNSEWTSDGKITGAFLGEGSIVYGYQLLYAITKEKHFLEYAKKHCNKVIQIVDTDIQHDLVGGNAGAILVYLNMYDLDQNEEYLKMARMAGDHLIHHAVNTEQGVGWKNISNDGLLGGFAHGCAGIMYALARLASYTEEKYLDVAYQAFSYERTLNHPELGGWKDERSKEPYYMNDFKWCHGVAGIVLGWNLAAEFFDETRKMEIRNEISKVIEDYPEMLRKEELGLCHGNLGNILIGYLAEVDVWKNSMKQNQAQSISVLHKILSEMKGNAILHEHFDYSLMTGWAGIGYGILCHLPMNLPKLLDVCVMDIQIG